MTPDAPGTDGTRPSAASGPGTSVAAPPDPATAAAAERIRRRFPDALVGGPDTSGEVLTGRHPFLRIAPARLVEVARLLRDDPDLRYDCCHLVSGIDWPPKTPAEGAGFLEAVYHLVSYARRPDAAQKATSVKTGKNDGWLCLKVRVPRDNPVVPSVMDVWPGADWHERETYDLVGIRFSGRSSLRRILLPEDWPGHPLRKDWEFPSDYHGVPIIPPEGR